LNFRAGHVSQNQKGIRILKGEKFS